MSKPVEPGFSEVALKSFVEQNSHARVVIEGTSAILIEKPWGRDDARLKLSVTDHEFIADLNQLVLDPRFDAAFHVDTNQIEFAFAFLKKDDEAAVAYFDRAFSFHFEGREYHCRFAEPSQRFMRLAAHYEGPLPSDSSEKSVPQLTAFRDFQKIDQLPPRARDYFAGRISRNFFVSCAQGFGETNLVSLARHLNFIAHYYDREAPLIVVKDAVANAATAEHSPVRLIEGDFPSALVVPKAMDDIVVRLLEVASTSSPRFSFLYCYQVFEYVGYYYIDEKSRAALRNALRDPALICSGEEKVVELFSIFSDLTHNDDVKMRKVIEDFCDPRVIWREVKNDLDFFSSSQNFDGGFVSQPLVAKDTTEATWCTMWMPKTYDYLTKIRNVLVHAREKRESRVILPTRANNALLSRYVPLILRIAEQLALKS